MTNDTTKIEIEQLREDNGKLRAALIGQEVGLQSEIERLRGLLFARGAMNDPPCFVCGYNGPGYYQPDVHPCAAEHHKRVREALGEKL